MERHFFLLALLWKHHLQLWDFALLKKINWCYQHKLFTVYIIPKVTNFIKKLLKLTCYRIFLALFHDDVIQNRV